MVRRLHHITTFLTLQEKTQKPSCRVKKSVVYYFQEKPKKERFMELVLLTALGVGGATVFGSLIGFGFKKISHKFADYVMAFAAGVMLAAAVLGAFLLFLPVYLYERRKRKALPKK